MLDPDEVAAFEEWREKKLSGSTDLSVAAFNRESEGPALAWEAGFDAAKSGATRHDNPYRRKGMTGHVARSEES